LNLHGVSEKNGILFSTLHGILVQTSDEKGVRLSVHPSVKCAHCNKTEDSAYSPTRFQNADLSIYFHTSHLSRST